MDEAQLTAEGYYATFGAVGARTEMPGCSLCMGNQARVAEKSTVVSTSTRNFPNRLGKGANVYLASAAASVEMGDDAYAGLGPAMRAQLKRWRRRSAEGGGVKRNVNAEGAKRVVDFGRPEGSPAARPGRC